MGGRDLNRGATRTPPPDRPRTPGPPIGLPTAPTPNLNDGASSTNAFQQAHHDSNPLRRSQPRFGPPADVPRTPRTSPWASGCGRRPQPRQGPVQRRFGTPRGSRIGHRYRTRPHRSLGHHRHPPQRTHQRLNPQDDHKTTTRDRLPRQHHYHRRRHPALIPHPPPVNLHDPVHPPADPLTRLHLFSLSPMLLLFCSLSAAPPLPRFTSHLGWPPSFTGGSRKGVRRASGGLPSSKAQAQSEIRARGGAAGC